jgi:PAS domain S-box-containing protein
MATGFQSEGMTTRCLRRAFDEVPIGLAILSGQPEHCGHVVDLNPYMADLFGCRPAELLSRSLAEHLQPSDHLPYEELVASVLATHQPASRELRTAPAAGGSGRYLALSASVVRDPAGGPSHIVVTAEDVGRRRDAEGRLIYQALHDPVTGLPNRLLFADRVGQALARAHGRGHLAVMVIDLDRFALVNESLGHAGGDRVLEETGRRLRATAGPAAGVARLGSDEFLVVVEGLDD